MDKFNLIYHVEKYFNPFKWTNAFYKARMN